MYCMSSVYIAPQFAGEGLQPKNREIDSDVAGKPTTHISQTAHGHRRQLGRTLDVPFGNQQRGAMVSAISVHQPAGNVLVPGNHTRGVVLTGHSFVDLQPGVGYVTGLLDLGIGDVGLGNESEF